MIQDSVSKYSPRWVADQLRATENKILDAAAAWLERTKWVHLVNLAIFVGFLVATYYFRDISREWGVETRGTNQLLIFRYANILNIIFFLTSLGAFAFYLKPQSLPALDLIGFVAGFLMLYYFRSAFSLGSTIGLTINLAVVFFSFLSLYFIRRHFNNPFLKWDFVIAGFLSLLLSFTIEQWLDVNTPWFFEISRFMFIFSLLSAEAYAKRNSSVGQEFSYLFSTMNFMTPVPVESKYRERTDQWSTRIHGLKDIFIGVLFIALAQKMRGAEDFPVNITLGSLFRYGFGNYIYYYLGSAAWIGIPVGLGRWFGMKLPAYFDFPLLATSPSDRWRRWNTYYYNWFYKIMFFPLFKKTKSLILATFAVFVGTLVMHAGRYNYGLFLGQTNILWVRNFIMLSLFFFLHAVLIYLGIKFPKLWISEKSRKGWCGILIITVIMSFLHIIVPT